MSRLEFDAYRSDLEELSLGPRDAVAMARIDAAQQQYQVQKDKYERLRSDVIIKLKFLEENKVSGLDLHHHIIIDLKNKILHPCVTQGDSFLSLRWR